MNIFFGKVTLSNFFCLPSEKGFTLNGKNLPGSTYFPFRVDYESDPFQKGFFALRESKQEVTKVVSLGGRSEKTTKLSKSFCFLNNVILHVRNVLWLMWSAVVQW